MKKGECIDLIGSWLPEGKKAAGQICDVLYEWQKELERLESSVRRFATKGGVIKQKIIVQFMKKELSDMRINYKSQIDGITAGLVGRLPWSERQMIEDACRVLYEMQEQLEEGERRIRHMLQRDRGGWMFGMFGFDLPDDRSEDWNAVYQVLDKGKDARVKMIDIPLGVDIDMANAMKQINERLCCGEKERFKVSADNELTYGGMTVKYEPKNKVNSDLLFAMLHQMNAFCHGKMELRWYYAGSCKDYRSDQGHRLYLAALSPKEWELLYMEFGMETVTRIFPPIPDDIITMDKGIRRSRNKKAFSLMKATERA